MLRPMRPYPLMATRMVIASPDVTRCRTGPWHGADGPLLELLVLSPEFYRDGSGEHLSRHLGDVLRSEAEVLEQHARGRGLAEAVEADHRRTGIVNRANVLAPAVAGSGFDRDPRNAGGQHARAIHRIL